MTRTSLLCLSLSLAALVALGVAPAVAQFDQPQDQADDEQAQAAEDQDDGAAAEEPAEAAEEPVEGEGEAGEEAAEEEADVEEELDPIAPDFNFEGEQLQPHWSCGGEEAALDLAGPGEARTGEGALVFRYMPAEGNLPWLTVTPLLIDAQPTGIEFALKTDEVSSIRVAVAEEDGTEYEAYCYSPGGEWTDVAIALDDFMLAQNSEDENAALDTAQITAISVADLCNLGGEVGRALGVKQGLQRLWLDDVSLGTGPVPTRSSSNPDGSVLVDDFDAAPALFLPVGAPRVEFVAGPQGDTGACRIVYTLGGHRWVGFVRGAGQVDLTGAEEVVLSLKAQQRARVVAVLEERDGSKYETNLELDPEAGWTDVTLPITQFVLDAATTDENRQLDLDQIRVMIVVTDTFNASVDALGEGSITVSRIVFR